MFCTKCGTALGENDKFCRKCGSSRELNAPYNSFNSAAEYSHKAVDSNSTLTEKHKSTGESHPVRAPRTKLIISLLIALAVLIGGGILFRNYTTTAKVKEQLNLGNKYLQEGKYEEAILAFTKVIEIEPKHIEARVSLGKAYIALDKPDDAEKVLKEALALDDRNVDAIKTLSRVYKVQRKANEAENLLKSALSIDPKDSEIYIQLAELYTDEGKIDDAITVLEEGISETGDSGPKTALDDIKTNMVSGNTNGNLVNMGHIGKQGDWIYYSGLYGKELCKANIDGSVKIKLCDHSAREINIIGDWVYYIHTTNNGPRVYKIKTDGTDSTELTHEQSDSLRTAGGWIYYLETTTIASQDKTPQDEYEEPEQEYAFYKMKLDGTDKTRISSDQCIYVNIAEDWIYYSDFSDNSKLYKMKTDGSNRTKLSDDRALQVVVEGDWIYYVNSSANSNIYKMKTDGTGKTRIVSSNVSYMNVSGDWIYYNNTNDNWSLYKVKTDGTNNMKLDYEQHLNGIYIIDDWIYYDVPAGIWSRYAFMYKIRPDGSGKEMVGTWPGW